MNTDTPDLRGIYDAAFSEVRYATEELGSRIVLSSATGLGLGGPGPHMTWVSIISGTPWFLRVRWVPELPAPEYWLHLECASAPSVAPPELDFQKILDILDRWDKLAA